MNKFKTLTEAYDDAKKREFNEYLLSTLSPDEQERYTIIDGLEGPQKLKNGKIVYYDSQEGKYYDRDTDMYMDYEEYRQHNEGVLVAENLSTVNEGYSEHLQQLVADIRAEKRDNMVIHILGEFGAMMAERGYERAKADFGGGDVQ